MYDWEWGGQYWGPWQAAVVLVLTLVILAIAVLVEFFFLRNLRDLLNRVSDRNRAMPSGHVWLNFIPLFGLGWFIYTVVKVRDSLSAEYRTRGWASEGDFGYGVGLAAGVLSVVAWVLGWLPVVAFGAVVGIGYLVCWIIYWVRTSRLKDRLGPRPAYFPPSFADAYSRYQGPATPYFPGLAAPPTPPGSQTPQGPYSPEDQARPDEEGADEPAEDGPTKYCPACGAGYDPGDRFCRSCGRPVG